jgi:hypothetical protein
MERCLYERIVGELARRHEEKVLPYYQARLRDVYRPQYSPSLKVPQ